MGVLGPLDKHALAVYGRDEDPGDVRRDALQGREELADGGFGQAVRLVDDEGVPPAPIDRICERRSMS
jgi:hypothetical protein